MQTIQALLLQPGKQSTGKHAEKQCQYADNPKMVRTGVEHTI